MRINYFFLLFTFILIPLSAQQVENTALFHFDRKVDNNFLKPYTVEANPDYFSDFYAMDISPYPAGNFYYGIGVDKDKNAAYFFNTKNKAALFAVNTDTGARALELTGKVAATPGGDFYIIDAIGKKIYYWNINGDHFTPAGVIDYPFGDPGDICRAQDVLYILDKTGPCLFKYSTVNHALLNFPGTGAAPFLPLAGLTLPSWGQVRGMAAGDSALFIVFEAGAVLKLDYAGNYLAHYKISSANLRLRTHRDKLYSQSWLESITIDPSGNVYVLDTAAKRIHIFNPGLDYLCSWYDPDHPIDDTAVDVCFAPVQDYFFLAHTWGFCSYKLKPVLSGIRLDHDTLYPALVGGEYKGIKIRVDVIGKGILDIIVKNDTLESKLVGGYSLPPATPFQYCWNGKLPDGQTAPEGNYTLQFFLDNVPAGEAAITVLPAPVLYLPGQDGRVLSPGHPEEAYNYEVYGKGVLTISINSPGITGDNIINRENIVYESLVENGRYTYTLRNVVKGIPLADGPYNIHFFLCPPELREYNIVKSVRSLSFIVNNQSLIVGSITRDKAAINPGFPALETITAAFTINEATLLTADILDEHNNLVTTLCARAYFQAGTVNITWDGFSVPGKQAPDGFYCFRITAYEETPAEPALVCTGGLFPLDSTPPEITLQATGYYLSPSEASSTGIRDALELIFSCNEPVTAECMLKSPAAPPGSYIATAVYSVLQPGAEATFSWDGRYADGTYAPDDTYKASIKVTDLYGNITAKGWPVVVDNNRQADTDRGVYLLQGEKIKVNTHTLIVKDKPCVAVDDNRVFITWAAKNPDTISFDLFGRFLDRNLEQPNTAQEFVVTDEHYNTGNSAFWQFTHNLASLADGFAAVWAATAYDRRDSLSIYTQYYNSAGEKTGSRSVITANPAEFIQWKPLVVQTAAGFLLAWQSYNKSLSSYNLKAQRFDQNREIWGQECTLISLENAFNNALLITGEHCVAAWQEIPSSNSASFTGLYARTFRMDGTALGNEYPVSTIPSKAMYDNNNPALASIKEGFVIAWVAQLPAQGIRSRIFNNAQEAQTPEFTVSTGTAGICNSPALAPFPGGFIVTWVAGSASKQELCGRLFDDTGLPLTGQFVLANLSARINPCYDITSSGSSFYLTWLDASGTAGPDTVYVKQVDILRTPGSLNLQAQLLYPTNTIVTDRDIPVKAVVSDLNLDSYTLTLTNDNGNSTLLKSETGKGVNGDLYLLNINRYLMNRAYTVTLAAWDKAGNRREDSFTFTRPDSPGFITDFTLNREHCSLSRLPEAAFSLADQAAVTLQITDTSYVLQKTSNPGVLPAGTNTRQVDISGLADGSYYLTVKADNSNTVYSSRLLFTVDNTPPEAALAAIPAYFGNGEPVSVPVPAIVTEANLSLVTLTIEDSGHVVVRELVNSINLLALAGAAFNPRTLSEGSYIITLAVEDRAGNLTTASHSFQVDRTPPSIEWITPDFTAVQSGVISVTADLTDQNGISTYRVSLAEPGTKLIADGKGSRIICTWDSVTDFPGIAGWVVLEISAADMAGNIRVEKHAFILDNHDPEIMFAFQSAPVSVDSRQFINAQNIIRVDAGPGDEYSAIQAVYYAVNDGDWCLYTGGLEFNTEGAYTLKVYCIDNHGNRSPVRETAFLVDTNAPSFTWQVQEPRYLVEDEIYVPLENNITITATGEKGACDSGLWKLLYRTADTAYTDYNAAEGIRIYKEGPQELFVKAVDRVGNYTEQSIGTFHLDLIPPRTQLEPGCPWYYSSQRRLIALNAPAALTLAALDPGLADACSGVAGTWYTLDGSAPILYRESIAITDNQVHTFQYYSTDNAGNTGQHESILLAVDTLPPQITITGSPGAYTNSGVIYVKSEKDLIIEAADNFAGVKQILYSINGGEYTILDNQLSFNGSPDAELSCYAVDYLDQQSSVISSHVVIDTAPPVTAWNSSLPVALVNGNYYAFAPAALTWSAVDEGCGVKSLSVRIDDTLLPQGTTDYTFTAPGKYSIAYFSTDYFNNCENEHTLVFQAINPLMGDVNQDGSLTRLDAIMTNRYVFNSIVPGFYKEFADMDGNGFIDISDAIIISRLCQ